MKRKFRILSMILTLTLVLSAFAGNLAFAEETTQSGGSSVISLDDFDSVTSVEKDSRNFYEIEVDQPEVQLQVKSSDETVLKASLVRESEDTGYYELTLEGWSVGTAAVTVTASDGTTVSKTIEVQDTGREWNYTAQADLSGDFTIPSGDSRYIKIHYESEDLDTFSFPTLAADNQDDFAVTLVGSDGDDFYYRVDAKGNDGKTAALSIGSSDCVIPKKLCNVSIAENSDLRIDTKSSYLCNVFDEYHFVVYTTSETAPDVSAYNDNLTVTPVGKVAGGYEYVMEAEQEGESLVQATLNGETAAFAVTVRTDGQPTVVSDTKDDVTIERGKTYTYKFSIMGGGTPSFAADQDGAFTVQSVRKDGIDYYCTVAATGNVGSKAALLVSFPDSGDDDSTVNAGMITVAEPVGITLKSDTNNDFSLTRGCSYVFRITGATGFYAGSSGAFSVAKLKTSGDDTFYKITATGAAGQAAGFYMSAPGRVPLKVCAVTVAPVSITSDTNSDFKLPASASYQFKITAPGADSVQFNAGSAGVARTALIKHVGNDFYYQVTAVGKPGSQTGIYVSAPGQAAKKLCVITVGKVDLVSDTNRDFSMAQGARYQFKLTASGASAVRFTCGTAGVVQPEYVGRNGSDFYYRVTASGEKGTQTGIYASVPGQDAEKLCVITIR